MSTTTAYFALLSQQLQRALDSSAVGDQNTNFTAYIARIAKGEPESLNDLHNQIRQLSNLDIGTDANLMPFFTLITANRKRFNYLARQYEALMTDTASKQSSGR